MQTPLALLGAGIRRALPHASPAPSTGLHRTA